MRVADACRNIYPITSCMRSNWASSEPWTCQAAGDHLTAGSNLGTAGAGAPRAAVDTPNLQSWNDHRQRSVNRGPAQEARAPDRMATPAAFGRSGSAYRIIRCQRRVYVFSGAIAVCAGTIQQQWLRLRPTCGLFRCQDFVNLHENENADGGCIAKHGSPPLATRPRPLHATARRHQLVGAAQHATAAAMYRAAAALPGRKCCLAMLAMSCFLLAVPPSATQCHPSAPEASRPQLQMPDMFCRPLSSTHTSTAHPPDALILMSYLCNQLTWSACGTRGQSADAVSFVEPVRTHTAACFRSGASSPLQHALRRCVLARFGGTRPPFARGTRLQLSLKPCCCTACAC